MAELSWDPRLTSRGATLRRAVAPAGTPYFRLVSGAWMDPVESQGKHHIFVEVLDERGQRMVGVPLHKDNGGRSTSYTEVKAGERWSQSIPMHNAGWPYSLYVGDLSDSLHGLGLGTIMEPMRPVHTSYGFIFQRAVMGDAGSPPGPLPGPPPEPPSEYGDWHTVFRLAEQLQELAVQHAIALGAPPQVAGLARRSLFPVTGPELAAITGISISNEWTLIAPVDWPGVDDFEMGLCWRKKGKHE